jgi:hypothetical protein
MPLFGRMPRSGGGGLDLCRRIKAMVGLLLPLLLLMWLEGSWGVGNAAFFNKLVAPGSAGPLSLCVDEALLSDRGGEGECRSDVVRRPLAHLLASHGGLEEWVRDSPILDLGSGSLHRRSCSRWWKVSLHAFSACRGGEEEICGRSASFQD